MLLSGDPEIEVVEECSDGRQAIESIQRRKPDLVYLDVQMPEMDGFAVLQAIAHGWTPVIIFVTAMIATPFRPSKCTRSITC
jgi:two-component system LytT family response regulator